MPFVCIVGMEAHLLSGASGTLHSYRMRAFGIGQRHGNTVSSRLEEATPKDSIQIQFTSNRRSIQSSLMGYDLEVSIELSKVVGARRSDVAARSSL